MNPEPKGDQEEKDKSLLTSDEKLRDMLFSTSTDSEELDEGKKIKNERNPLPGTSKDQPLEKPAPNVSTKYVPKGPKMIDPLPMPMRRAHQRGISEGTVNKIVEQKEAEEIREILGEEPRKSSSSDLPSKNFYGKMSAKKFRMRDLEPKSRKVPKSKDERRAQLKQLAEVDKQKREEEESVVKPKPKPAYKGFQSVPKTKRLLQDCDTFKFPTSAANKKNNILQKPTSIPRISPAVASSSVDSKSPAPPSSVVSETRKQPRTQAEKEITSDGFYKIKKMSFGNVLSNVCSQQLHADPEPSEFEKVTAAADQSPKTCLASSTGAQRGMKQLSWKEDGRGTVCVEIKYIEKIGFKKVVPMSGGKQVDASLAPPQSNFLTPKKINFTAILYRILSWNTNWLAEQDKLKEAPPVHGENSKLRHVPPSFRTYMDYCKIFFPLMLHELWTEVHRNYSTLIKEKALEVLICVTSQRQVLDHPNLEEICCLGFISEDHSKRRPDDLPTEGWLAVLDMRFSQPGQPEQLRPTFAHVKSCRKRKRLPFDAPYSKIVEDAVPSGKKLTQVMELTLTIKSVRSSLQVNRNKPWILKGISRVQPSLRVFHAVCDAPSSPLFPSILRPDDSTPTFKVTHGMEDYPLALGQLPEIRSLNEEQHRIVKSVGRACTTRMMEPHISLIQGPPGTGKTSTIVALILQIIFRFRHYNPTMPVPRILVAAPSNAAVDEIATRLRHLVCKLHNGTRNHSINMMRIGKGNKCHQDVKQICFETLRDKEFLEMKRKQTSNVYNDEVRQRQEKINEYGLQLAKASEENDTDLQSLLLRKMRSETELMNEAKASGKLSSREEKTLRFQAGQRIFEHAHVVFATLNSSLNNQMLEFLDTGNHSPQRPPFSVAIIDEASQCVEPESLIPFSLGFPKLVMVGDPEQLPATVTSVIAKQNRYNDSMFKRLFEHFSRAGTGSFTVNPVQKLRTQYRMHPDIVHWPNKYFYGGALVTGTKSRDSFLRPYILFNVTNGCERQKGSSIWNDEEVEFIGNVVRTLQKEIKARKNSTMKIGVITFYSKQKDLIWKHLEKIGLTGCVEVKTVDGFQGSECDIMLISCVRTKKHGIGFLAENERLNVALTRGKFAMFVVGNFERLRVCLTDIRLGILLTSYSPLPKYFSSCSKCENYGVLFLDSNFNAIHEFYPFFSFQGNTMWDSLIQDGRSRKCLEYISRGGGKADLGPLMLLPPGAK